MSNSELIVQSNLGDLTKVASASRFHPRLQLFGGSSDAVKRLLIPVRHWGIVKGQDITHDLGTDVEAYILAGRAKALDTGGKDGAVISYTPSDAIFKTIQARSAVMNSKCMFGPEFLVWLANVGWATYFACNESARQEAHALVAAMGKSVIMGSRVAEGKGRSWVAPTTEATEPTFDLPPADEVDDVRVAFLNPPKEEREAAPEEPTGRAR